MRYRCAWSFVFFLLAFALLSASFAGGQATATSPAPAATGQTNGGSQAPNAEPAQAGTIVGTVTDPQNEIVSGATVILQGPAQEDRRSVVTSNRGFFQFQGVPPGVRYRVTVNAKGFSEWTSPVVLEPNQYKILNSALQLEVRTEVTVTPEQIAVEQVREELQQRVFGILPNFYVVYDQNAAPLTPKLKFKLALRTMVDPVTIAGVAFFAGIDQAADNPDYSQGAAGYGKRFGAIYADGISDVLIGGAILPSLLHQDPRYFYRGTGTTKSRLFYAVRSSFMCRGDNGKFQPNYSTILGDLSSAAISNAYYPESNRGAGLVFGNLAIGTAMRATANIMQEFVLSRFTHRKGQ